MKNQIQIIIGGDVVPTDINYQDFITGNVQNIVSSEIQTLFKEFDLGIINLEVPLTDNKYPIEKSGPVLYAPKECICGIKNLGVDLVCLANNHILDHGEIGVKQTIETLDNSKISHIGAGNNLEEAKTTYIYEKNNIKIGFYNCAEHEFNIATTKSAGANPYEPLETFDDIYNLSKIVDCVVVIFHGMREYYRYPSPNIQKICRKFVEKGANVVLCQHSHCVGCREKYQNGEILYGQGNFIFKKENQRIEWQTGLLAKIVVTDKINIEYLPLSLNEKVININYNLGILEDFNKRSKEICKEDFIEENYKKEAEKALNNYISHFTNKKKYAMLNDLNCEAHREVFYYGLKYGVITPKDNKKNVKGKKNNLLKIIIQNIFSITNEFKNNKKRKVIVILGFRFKFRIS